MRQIIRLALKGISREVPFFLRLLVCFTSYSRVFSHVVSMNSTTTKSDYFTRIEQDCLLRLSDALCCEGVTLYEDRGEYGYMAFIVCRDTKTAREIVEDSPALYEVRGSSLIITCEHPGREEGEEA